MKARDNPFAVQRILKVAYEPLDETWPEMLERLERMRYRGSVLGHHGSGKSTLLDGLRQQLGERGVRVISLQLNDYHPAWDAEDQRCIEQARDGESVVLLDGAERLGWLAWRRFLKRIGPRTGVVITIHHPQKLPLWYRCLTDPELLARLIAGLEQSDPDSLLPLARELHAAHQGNLREALREMYDRYSAR